MEALGFGGKRGPAPPQPGASWIPRVRTLGDNRSGHTLRLWPPGLAGRGFRCVITDLLPTREPFKKLDLRQFTGPGRVVTPQQRQGNPRFPFYPAVVVAGLRH